jgi:hypothetical protein
MLQIHSTLIVVLHRSMVRELTPTGFVDAIVATTTAVANSGLYVDAHGIGFAPIAHAAPLELQIVVAVVVVVAIVVVRRRR